MSARIVAVILVCLLLLSPCAQAQTLWQAWQATKMHDPEFRSARAALRAAQAAHPEAVAALLPHLDASANHTINNDSSSGPEFYGSQIVSTSQSANTHATGWQVQLSQTLFDWSSVKRLEAAGLDAASAAATYQTTLGRLAEKLTKTYLDVLSAQANLQATSATAQGFAEQYREANARYKAGLSGIIGAEASQAALASAQADVLSARQQLTAAENALAALTGQPATSFPALPISYHVTVSGTRNTWLQRALVNNPRLAAAQLNVRAEQARVGAAESGYLPSVSLTLTHGHNSQNGYSDYAVPGKSVRSPAGQLSSGNSIGLQLSWNLFSGGTTRARVDGAQAAADEASANTATTRMEIARDIKTRYAAITVDAARIARLRSAVNAARAAVRATEKGVPAGVRTEDDLVTQRERLLAMQQQLDATVAAAIADKVALARAGGALTPARIKDLSDHIGHSNPENTPSHPSGDKQ